jgi:hypothetical protein
VGDDCQRQRLAGLVRSAASQASSSCRRPLKLRDPLPRPGQLIQRHSQIPAQRHHQRGENLAAATIMITGHTRTLRDADPLPPAIRIGRRADATAECHTRHVIPDQLPGAKLDDVKLERADLNNVIGWEGISSMKGAQIAGVKNVPDGFREFANQRGTMVD